MCDEGRRRRPGAAIAADPTLRLLPDWIFTLVLLLVIGILTDKAGYKREFSLTDTSIQHTYAQDQRSGLELGTADLLHSELMCCTCTGYPSQSVSLMQVRKRLRSFGNAQALILASYRNRHRPGSYHVHLGSRLASFCMGLAQFVARPRLVVQHHYRNHSMCQSRCRSTPSRFDQSVSTYCGRRESSPVWARHDAAGVYGDDRSHHRRRVSGLSSDTT